MTRTWLTAFKNTQVDIKPHPNQRPTCLISITFLVSVVAGVGLFSACRTRILQFGGVRGAVSAQRGDPDGVGDVRPHEGRPLRAEGVRSHRLRRQRHGHRRRPVFGTAQLPLPTSRPRHARRQRVSRPGGVTPRSRVLVPSRWAALLFTHPRSCSAGIEEEARSVLQARYRNRRPNQALSCPLCLTLGFTTAKEVMFSPVSVS